MRKQERLKAARKTRASAALVGIIVLTGLGCSAFKFAAQRSDTAILAIVLFGLLGVVLLILEPTARFQRANELRILRFYRSPRFYGLVISVSSALIMGFAFAMTPIRATARQINGRKPLPPVVRAEPVVKAPPTFPCLKVTGVVINGRKSFALINGRTVQLGEYFSGVRLARVNEDFVVVELDGFEQTYPREPHAATPAYPPARR